MGASLNQGAGGKGGRRARARRHLPMAEINVTPFVDVMLVLLIIFMVAAPLLTSGVPVELPSAAGKPLDAPKEPPVVVTIDEKGQIFIGQDDKAPLKVEELGTRLTGIAKNRRGSDEPIFVHGHKSTNYGTFAVVMAAIKEAGFKKLSLVTEPPNR
ncbi:MAG TPA: ExbD/TolR family protein [Hyphomicrobiaceae bacterium]|nr:ExbD/TolR family protein [Hyphomicrobiaceae bacterium]